RAHVYLDAGSPRATKETRGCRAGGSAADVLLPARRDLVEAGEDLDLALVKPDRPFLPRPLVGDDLRHGLARARDDDLLARGGLFDQLREVRVLLVHAHVGLVRFMLVRLRPS